MIAGACRNGKELSYLESCQVSAALREWEGNYRKEEKEREEKERQTGRQADRQGPGKTHVPKLKDS